MTTRSPARPLIARRSTPAPTPAPHDPAPSRLSYRVTRLWLTPIFRKALHLGIPVFALFAAVTWYLGDETRVAELFEAVQEIRREVENRPEFRVNVLGIDGASDDVTEQVRAALALDLPISSFDLDLDELRGRLEALPPVRTADLRIQSGGYLAVRIDERIPAAVWLTHEGLSIVDGDGIFVAGFGTRELAAPLPLLGGEGANLAVPEALALMEASSILDDRVHGLVRMGERRWDVVLTNGSRILLPEIGAAAALDRVLALDDMGEILSRDVTAVDVRNPGRLTVRLTDAAMEELQRLQTLAAERPDGDTRG
ncbi:cell division protein FtsQ [Jannaschia sp. CCS1]|uniref:Cell division protein FtsQ n=1 Tax=Jannaschia sp. (strain CCS1) TaxID=290400 RepID=FTSQ_JANSC|nr:RecName: Full=Cell division protein FtsQ [Jannaschia sp. CCS1]ABD55669.1 cell division protein FtsQ [Jannaschia sp. CCS1]